MVEQINKKIGSIPPLDDTVVKIQQGWTNPNSSINELIQVAGTDPILTANILKSANSPLYGFSREINSISHAISLFGMVTIKGFALVSAFKKSMKIDLSPYCLPNQKFLDICTLQSALMLHWYSKVDRELLQLLLPAAFMMELGKVILANVAIEEEKKEKFAELVGKASSADIHQIEIDFFGMASEDVTAKIFVKWNLEIEGADAIKYSYAPEDAPKQIGRAHV